MDGTFREIDASPRPFGAGLYGGERPAPALGLRAYGVVRDDFIGPLAPHQLRRAQHDDLRRYGFDRMNVVADDVTGPLQKQQLRQESYAALQQAWLNMGEGRGMALEGSVADKDAFKAMLAAGFGGSPQFRALFSSIGNHATDTITADLGRHQPGVAVDAFEHESAAVAARRRTQTIDLGDYDKIPGEAPAAHPDAQTRTQKLIHALTEAQMGAGSSEADAGRRYLAAHEAAIDEENRYRDEQGQQGHRRKVDPESNAAGDWTYDYGASKETWRWNGDRLDSIAYD